MPKINTFFTNRLKNTEQKYIVDEKMAKSAKDYRVQQKRIEQFFQEDNFIEIKELLQSGNNLNILLEVWPFIFQVALKKNKMELLGNILQDKDIQTFNHADSTHEMLKILIKKGVLSANTLIDALKNDHLDYEIKKSILKISLDSLSRIVYGDRDIEHFLEQIENLQLIKDVHKTFSNVGLSKRLERLEELEKEKARKALSGEIKDLLTDCVTLSWREKPVYFPFDVTGTILDLFAITDPVWRSTYKGSARHPITGVGYFTLVTHASARLHIDILLFLLMALPKNQDIKKMFSFFEEFQEDQEFQKDNADFKASPDRLNMAKEAVNAILSDDTTKLQILNLATQDGATIVQDPLCKKITALTKEFVKLYNLELNPDQRTIQIQQRRPSS